MAEKRMLTSMFGGQGNAPPAVKFSSARAVHDALTEGLDVAEAFTQHTAQLTEELKRVQKQRHEEREAARREQQQADATWLQRVRSARLETSLRAGLHARDLRGLGRTIKLWAEVVGLLRRESLQQRQSREQSLQLRLRDSGRAELQLERDSLGKQAAASALAAQQLRAALSARSLELERTIVRDTMAFELQAADALRTKKVLEEVQRKREQADAAHQAQITALREEMAAHRVAASEQQAQAEHAVGVAMGGEVAQMERELKVRAANQAIVVRCAVEHSTIHRYWRMWASVASLLLREAGGALLQLELSKQQQRGVHTRLQAELAAEVAMARVENIEARTLLTKAQALEQLRPGHELAMDKELLREQSRALQAAHESAAAAHLAAAAHRVGEQALTRDLRVAETGLSEISSSATYGRAQMSKMNARIEEDRQRAQQEAEREIREKAAMELMEAKLQAAEQAAAEAAAEAEVAKAQAAEQAQAAAAATPPQRASPRASPGPKPRAASPAGGDRPAGKPPRAPGRGRGR